MVQKYTHRNHWKREKGVFFLLALLLSGFTMSLGTVTKALAGQSLGGVTLTEVAPRIVTPNGDLLNDVVYFKFDSALSGLPIESEIMDINGAKVAGMTLNSNETSLLWDGKDDSGRVLPAGIYIYSIKIGQNQATGTVVVAR